MPQKRVKNYRWVGIHAHGHIYSGTIATHHAKLISAYLYPHIIDILSATPCRWAPYRLSQPLTIKHLTHFTEQLSDLLQQSIPLLDALTFIETDYPQWAWQNLLRFLKHTIKTGHSLAYALQHSPYPFNTFYIKLVHAGETTGTLATQIKQLSEQLHQSTQQRKKTIQALQYPLFLLAATLIILLILSSCVIPQFQQLFQQLDTPLPAFTQTVIHCSNLLSQHAFVCITTPLLIAIAWRYKKKAPPILIDAWDKVLWHIPIVKIYRHYAYTQAWLYVLALSLQAGIPIHDALTLAINSLSSTAYKKKLANVGSDIRSGVSFYHAIKRTSILPNSAMQRLHIAEETGTLATTLSAIHDALYAQFNRFLTTITKWIEPLMMILLSGLIGCIVLALYLPVFQIGLAL